MTEPSTDDWRAFLAAHPTPTDWVALEEILQRGLVDDQALACLLILKPAYEKETQEIQLGDFIARIFRFAELTETLFPGTRESVRRLLQYGSD